MSITMPTGVNQFIFYLKCKERGIKIRSQYTGVSFHLRYGKPSWIAKIQRDGKLLWFEDFPLSEIGEQEAYATYLYKRKELGMKRRYDNKRKPYKHRSI